MNASRLLYLLNNHPGFLPTADQWEEVKKLAAEAVRENEALTAALAVANGEHAEPAPAGACYCLRKEKQ